MLSKWQSPESFSPNSAKRPRWTNFWYGSLLPEKTKNMVSRCTCLAWNAWNVKGASAHFTGLSQILCGLYENFRLAILLNETGLFLNFCCMGRFLDTVFIGPQCSQHSHPSQGPHPKLGPHSTLGPRCSQHLPSYPQCCAS